MQLCGLECSSTALGKKPNKEGLEVETVSRGLAGQPSLAKTASFKFTERPVSKCEEDTWCPVLCTVRPSVLPSSAPPTTNNKQNSTNLELHEDKNIISYQHNFWQRLSIYLPMTWTINLFKETLSSLAAVEERHAKEGIFFDFGNICHVAQDGPEFSV